MAITSHITMQNDETTPDVVLDENQNNEAEVETNENEVDTEATEDTESIDWKAEAAKWKAIAKRNEQKQKAAPVQSKKQDSISRDEVILLAQGYDEKDLEYLSIIAKGKNVSLRDATQDDLFVAFAEKRNAEKKALKAKLGVSKSSGVSKQDSSFKKPMTAEEHKALFEKTILGK